MTSEMIYFYYMISIIMASNISIGIACLIVYKYNVWKVDSKEPIDLYSIDKVDSKEPIDVYDIDKVVIDW